jgi:hypothetical protein
MGHLLVKIFIAGLHKEGRVDCDFDELMQDVGMLGFKQSGWDRTYFLVNFELLDLTWSTRPLTCSNW